MKKLLSLCVPLGSEIMTTVRLTTGGVCSLVGLGLDDSEDCKVCVTESLLLLLHAGYRETEVLFKEENEHLYMEVAGMGCADDAKEASEDEISAALLTALAADTLLDRKDGRIVRVTFSFKK